MIGDMVLVTGATGYVGGRIVPRLLAAGYQVRVLVRDPARLQGRSWLDRVDVVQGDVLDPQTLGPALDGVQAAYYLIHSMMAGKDFKERDQLAANQFVKAGEAAPIQRIIYLGGLGDPDTDLSEHLRSRHETGEVLRSGSIPVLEFRAGVIVGAGSLSFEMIRDLTERLPAMICPRWVFTRTQPISIRNILDYLVAGLEVPLEESTVIEIGGPEILTYGDMIMGYAEVRGLRRWIVPVPVLTPRLSSYWVHWITPIPSQIARPLIEGLKNEAIVRDTSAPQIFSEIELEDYLTAVRQALESLQASAVETTWSDALVSTQGDIAPVILSTNEGMIVEQRKFHVHASPQTVYRTFTGLGGSRGWLYASWLWRLRGALDRLIGGVGYRRGRRDPDVLRIGDALDFWRVEDLEHDHLLRLRAEMKVPGKAWLEFETIPGTDQGAELYQTAYYAPKGLIGLLYWYIQYPIHARIFSGLIRAVAKHAEALVVDTFTQPRLNNIVKED
jgi:uncharacterized protein YbjT (DUF2867 family)